MAWNRLAGARGSTDQIDDGTRFAIPRRARVTKGMPCLPITTPVPNETETDDGSQPRST